MRHMRLSSFLLPIFFSLCFFSLQAQMWVDTVGRSFKTHWSERSAQPNPYRITGVSVGCSAAFGAALAGLSIAWYGKYDKGPFHWFDDGKEWNQIDKTGHVFAPYFIANWTYDMYRWAGVNNRNAAIASGILGMGFISAIEVLDGFSAKWGASWSDLAANGAGALLSTGQYLLWGEQRILLKYSFHEVRYPERELRDRAQQLFGQQFGERILKDYNGITMWLSINLHSFNHRIKPAWLNLAIGYGAGNMYGGFENKWTDREGKEHDRTDVQRYRKFLISIDADFTRIPVKSKGLRTFLRILNIVKLPMPALEFNTLGQFVLHPMYFLNWEYPIVIPMKK